MSDAKPYAMEEFQQKYDPDSDSSILRVEATVRALDAAQAEVTALRAEAKERQRVLEQAIEEQMSALSERNWANERHEEAVAENAALRARVAELEVVSDRRLVIIHEDKQAAERERDEWKMKYEAAEKLAADKKVWNEYIDGKFEEARAALVKQRDEAAALAERLLEALRENLRRVEAALTQASILNVSYSVRDSLLVAERSMGTALSTPAPAWLAERDRALAMRVAEAVYRSSLDEYLHNFQMSDADKAHLDAIVDAALKEMP